MLSLTDPIWHELEGGYRVPYDASKALARMERGKSVWDEFWNELHHQGDVGVASYAAIPQLVRSNGRSSKQIRTPLCPVVASAAPWVEITSELTLSTRCRLRPTVGHRDSLKKKGFELSTGFATPREFYSSRRSPPAFTPPGISQGHYGQTPRFSRTRKCASNRSSC
jgi:hypothetical protein